MWEWGEVERKRALRRNGSNVVLLAITESWLCEYMPRK